MSPTLHRMARLSLVPVFCTALVLTVGASANPGPQSDNTFATSQSGSNLSGDARPDNPAGPNGSPLAGDCPVSSGAGGDWTLTQSLSDVEAGGQVACAQADIGTTRNGWARCFNLEAEGVPAGVNLTINSVTFSVQQATIDGINVDVVLYIDCDGCPPIEIGLDVTEIARASTVVNISDEGGSITVNFPGGPVVPAGTDLIVEVECLDDGTEEPFFSFRAGSNADGQCGPSYLRAADCGFVGWVDTADIGFEDSMLILSVDATEGGEVDVECNPVPDACNEDAGPCDEAHEGPGCNDVLCCALVCGVNALCCIEGFNWDQDCVDEAVAQGCIDEPIDCPEGGDTELTQSVSLDIVGGSVACSPDDGVTTTENSFARSFELQQDFDLNCVVWGIEANSQDVDVDATVNVYMDIDGGPPVGPNTDLILLATRPLLIGANDDGKLLVTSFVPAVQLKAGDFMVIELDIPDQTDITGIWPGSNGDGQSGPSYIRSDSCGLTDYDDLANIGFPDMHLVLLLIGNGGGGDPCIWDLTNDGEVGLADLLKLLEFWGDPYALADLLDLLAAWGPCP